jgi:hypothetical protein
LTAQGERPTAQLRAVLDTSVLRSSDLCRFLTPQAFLDEIQSSHSDPGLAERADQAGRQLP